MNQSDLTPFVPVSSTESCIMLYCPELLSLSFMLCPLGGGGGGRNADELVLWQKLSLCSEVGMKKCMCWFWLVNETFECKNLLKSFLGHI